MHISFTRALVPAALIGLAAFGWSRSQAPEMMGPSAEQKRLAPLIGEWDVALTMHTPTGEMPMVGTEKNRLICDGKWLESEFRSDFNGMPFEGRMLMGYDAEKKAYAGVWVDSMGPAFTVMQGSWSDENESVTWTHEATDMMGRHGTNRSVEVMPDENTRKGTSYFKPDGEEEAISMEFNYRRKGTGKPAEAASGTKKTSGD